MITSHDRSCIWLVLLVFIFQFWNSQSSQSLLVVQYLFHYFVVVSLGIPLGNFSIETVKHFIDVFVKLWKGRSPSWIVRSNVGEVLSTL